LLFDKQITASQNSLKSLSEAQKSKNNFASFPSYVLEFGASHMGLKVGEEMSFYDLLEGTMVVSADDASNVIAEVMGNGSIDACVEDVNRYIKSLGLHSTHFTNPHGLHHPEHVSTALDLAKLSQEAMKDPLFRKMAKAPRFLRPKTNKQPSVYLQGTNRLLIKGSNAYYAPATGVKTGYHRRAGYCLVSAAEKDDRSLIAVVLQCSSRDERFRDTIKLFQAAFDEKKAAHTYLSSGPQTFSREIEGSDSPLLTYTNEPITYAYYPSEKPQTSCQLVWQKVSLPLQKGTPVGELLFYADGQMVQQVTLLAANGVEETLIHMLQRHMGPWTVAGLIVFIGIGFLIFFRKK
jgi:D-alanyl-D-alanine carboxypeptidase (penicillin-binding protein 5/6)